MSENINMTEEKAKRIAIGVTIAGVLLVLFLLIVMVIQFVQMAVKNSENKELEALEKQYSEMIESQERDIEYYQTELGMYRLARREGWR